MDADPIERQCLQLYSLLLYHARESGPKSPSLDQEVRQMDAMVGRTFCVPVRLEELLPEHLWS